MHLQGCCCRSWFGRISVHPLMYITAEYDTHTSCPIHPTVAWPPAPQAPTASLVARDSPERVGVGHLCRGRCRHRWRPAIIYSVFHTPIHVEVAVLFVGRSAVCTSRSTAAGPASCKAPVHGCHHGLDRAQGQHASHTLKYQALFFMQVMHTRMWAGWGRRTVCVQALAVAAVACALVSMPA
jgi:hypothetical protein